MPDSITAAGILLVVGPLVGAIPLANPSLLGVWSATRDAHLATIGAHRTAWAVLNLGFGFATIATAAGLAILALAADPDGARAAALTAVALAYAVGGALWCALQFPIIKAIWTSSFVLVTAGYSAILLGIIHQVVDVWRWRRWATIFTWIGANAITLYLLVDILDYDSVAERIAGGDFAAFLDNTVTKGTRSAKTWTNPLSPYYRENAAKSPPAIRSATLS